MMTPFDTAVLSPTERQALKLKVRIERERRRRKIEVPPPTFVEFVAAVNPKYQFYPAVKRLAAVLEKVLSGEIKRLMVFMPPRHGKSELISRLFSAYYLYIFPDRWVGINSYASELAYTFSRNSRENYTRFGGRLSGSATAVKHWETNKGGGLWAAGVGGPITGKGFHLGIIDDPLKNAEEAESETIREKHKDWYNSTFLTREESVEGTAGTADEGGAIIIVLTRWHEEDLAGWLLSQELDAPEQWHIVHYAAIKEKSPPDYPYTCTVEHDPRKPGEPVAPTRRSKSWLLDKKTKLTPYFWGSLYQQTPKPREGNMFKRAWFEVVAGVPANYKVVKWVRYWDKAGSKEQKKNKTPYTAGILMGLYNGTFYVVDMVLGQWEAAEREKIIKQTAMSDRATYGKVTIGVEQEPGSGGKESAQSTVMSLAGETVIMDRPQGDKILRADPVAVQAGINNIKLVAGEWNKRYLDIITAFPNAAVKDPVDATSGAFAMLAPLGGSGNELDSQESTKQESKWTKTGIPTKKKGSRWRM